MARTTANSGTKVVYLRPANARAARLREGRHRVVVTLRMLVVGASGVAALAVSCALVLLRVALCTVLVLLEPLLRITLVPLAFLSFAVVLVFGFLIGDPMFPKWAMLAFSVGALWLYWLFLGMIHLLMRSPRRERH